MPKSTHTGEYDHFRLLLVQARKKAGLSQAQLVERLRKPQSFERGERRLDVVEFKHVAEAVGVDPLRFLRRAYGPKDGPK